MTRNYKGHTLWLFKSSEEAIQTPGAVLTKEIGSGWIVMLDNGRWCDALGLLPIYIVID